jgi:tripartite-type tricarboxylate transporter receptor subunit TctC
VTRLLLAISTILAVSHAAGQARYPDRPIHVLVGFPAGSTADVAARLLGQKWSEAMSRPVVVENLAGAAGNIAVERVARCRRPCRRIHSPS